MEPDATIKEAAEAKDRIGNVSADFVDHQPLDRADPLAAQAAYDRTFDAIACDQRVMFGFGFCDGLCCRHDALQNSRQFNSQGKCGFHRAKRQAGQFVIKSGV